MTEDLARDRVLTARACAAEGERLIKAGTPLVAYDTLADGLKRWPGDTRLRQLTALALARTGASRLAERLLAGLVDDGVTDEETLGLLGRVHKDLWAHADQPRERLQHLQQAFRYYSAAHAQSGGYWSGINAATTALLLGLQDTATALARHVQTQCLLVDERGDEAQAPYWLFATLGEAALVLGDHAAAERWYMRAGQLAGRRLGDLASTRRNARLILAHLGLDTDVIDRWLPVPRVAVLSGHLIDRPGRTPPRFPAALEPAVQGVLRDWVRTAGIGFGYASAGSGADILFLEALIDAGIEAHVVLPYDRDSFRHDSVDIVPGGTWGDRYDRVLRDATDVTEVSDQRMAGALAYEYGFLVLDGMAAMRADELDTSLVCLAVWDGQEGDGPGGTADSVRHWRALDRPLDVIDVTALRARNCGDLAPPRQATPRMTTRTSNSTSSLTPVDEASSDGGVPAFDSEMVGLLFGDVRGFSRLTDEQIPLFVTHVLGAIAGELAESPHTPLLANTWGDGLYLVFRTVRETGEFALRLSEAVRAMDWAARGLPADLGLRVGLHAGPAYACGDPVTGRRNYLGAHVSRAARIEPITPPGEVYASGAFAALARAEQVTTFQCGYVGNTPLAKGYGSYPTYVVHRRRRR